MSTKQTAWLTALLVVVASFLSVPQVAGAESIAMDASDSPGGDFRDLIDVGVSDAGAIYGVDRKNRVVKFSSTGQFVKQWGTTGSGPGQLMSPTGVEVDPVGNVWVSDRGNRRIVKFSPAGALLDAWSLSSYSSDGPNKLAVDSSGNFYATFSSPDSVAKFDASGALLDNWGSEGTTDGTFNDPWDIDVRSPGRIYVTDTQTDRVQAFDPGGMFLTGWTTGEQGGAIGVASEPGRVYTVSYGSGVRVTSPTGTPVAQVVSKGAQIGKFHNPAAIEVDESYVYVADEANRRIVKLDKSEIFARLEVSPRLAVAGQPVTFDASSSEALQTLTKFEWDLDGDGVYELDTGASPIARKHFPQRGVYATAVRVTGAEGGVGTATVKTHAGPVGVSINSGEKYTNDQSVDVDSVWPLDAQQMLVSNDGGFATLTSFPVQDTVAWRLDSSGPERLPKTIYVRFSGGESGPETYQDDIILDETAPTIESAKVVGLSASQSRSLLRKRGVKIKLRAKDKTSGVKRMQAGKSKSKAKRGGWKKYKRKFKYTGGGRKAYVRVQDAAGNASKWKKVKLR